MAGYEDDDYDWSGLKCADAEEEEYTEDGDSGMYSNSVWNTEGELDEALFFQSERGLHEGDSEFEEDEDEDGFDAIGDQEGAEEFDYSGDEDYGEEEEDTFHERRIHIGSEKVRDSEWAVVELGFNMTICPKVHSENNIGAAWSPTENDTATFWKKMEPRGIFKDNTMGGIRVTKLRNEYGGGIAVRGSLRPRSSGDSDDYDSLEIKEGERLDNGMVEVKGSSMLAHFSLLKGESITPDNYEEIAARPKSIPLSPLNGLTKESGEEWTTDELRSVIDESKVPKNPGFSFVSCDNPVIDSIRELNKTRYGDRYDEERMLPKNGKVYKVSREMYLQHVKMFEKMENSNATFGDFIRNAKLIVYKQFTDSPDPTIGFGDTAEIGDNMSANAKTRAMERTYRITGMIQVDVRV